MKTLLVLMSLIIGFQAVAQDVVMIPDSSDSHMDKSARLYIEAAKLYELIETIQPGAPRQLATVVRKLMESNREAILAVRTLLAETSAAYTSIQSSLKETQLQLAEVQTSCTAVDPESLEKSLATLEMLQSSLNASAVRIQQALTPAKE